MSEIESGAARVIQCKVCLVGAFAVGKSSLVRRFVHSMFSETYLTTVGVKIDRRDVPVDDTIVRMLIWDLAGEDPHQPLYESYLRGASACLMVGDLTRPETVERLATHREVCESVVGAVPVAVLFNKSDLTDEREADDAAMAQISARTVYSGESSAKTGTGVSACFDAIARARLAQASGDRSEGG